MSTREIVHEIVEQMTEEELQAIIILFPEKAKKPKNTKSLKGAFSHCANKNLMALEKEAWGKAATEKYENA